MATPGNIDQLNFEVILNDKNFTSEINRLEQLANRLNTSLSGALDLSRKVSSQKMTVKTREAENSLEKLNEYFRNLEKQSQKTATGLKGSFDFRSAIEPAYAELNSLLEVMKKIEERKQSGARIQYSDSYVNNVAQQAEAALRGIQALEEAQKRLTGPSNGFQEHIRNLTTTNMTLMQMRQYYADLEKHPEKVAKSQATVTKEMQKTASSAKDMARAQQQAMSNSMFQSHIRGLTQTNMELVRMREYYKGLESAQQKLPGLINAARAAQKKHAQAVKETNFVMQSSQNILSKINQLTGYAFSIIGIKRFLSTMIDVTGQFEMQHMALRNMMQDVDAADKLFKQLYDFSTESTYRFSELAKYAKQLSAFNIGNDNLLETTKMLGDVASGVGVSMDRLILAFGHVKSSGFLRGIQLRSFSQNGVPILEELSKMFTEVEGKAVSLGDVFDKMMKREIPFEMVEEAFRRMTSEGGKFYRMQEVLSKTLAGQINILKGKWENMMYAIGQTESGTMKNVVASLINMVDHMQEIVAVLKPLIVAFGTYKAAILLVGAAQKGLRLLEVAQSFIRLTKASNALSASVRVLGVATKAAAGWLGLFSIVIYGVVKAFRSGGSELDRFKKKLDDIHKASIENNSYDKEISEIKTLRDILSNANNAYDQRKAALDKIRDIVPAYHAELTSEGRLINNNTTAINNYIDGLNREAKALAAKEELVELYKEQLKLEQSVAAAQKDYEDSQKGLVQIGTGLMGAPVYASTDTRKGMLDNEQKKLDEVNGRIKNLTDTVQNGLSQAGDAYANSPIKVSSIIEGIKKIDAQLDKLRKKAKDPDGITQAEYETLTQLQKDREEYAKQYKEIMGTDYDKQIREDAKSAADAVKTESDAIKDQVEVLRKYMGTYKEFEALVGGEMAKTLTNKAYGVEITDFNFLPQIDDLLGRLENLGKKDVADSIRASMGIGEGRDSINQLKKAQQTAKSYADMIRSWKTEDTDISETGFFGKMDKVVSDLRTKLAKVTLQGEKAKETLRGIDLSDPAAKASVINGLVDAGFTKEDAEQFWKDFYENGYVAIDNLVEELRHKAYVGAQKSINDLASSTAKELTKGLNLTDWGDKSLKQVYDIWKQLEGMVKGDVDIPEEVRDKVVKAGLSLRDFRKMLKGEFEKMSAEAKEELEKKIAKSISELIPKLNSAAQAVKDFADAAGKDGLAAVADGFIEVGNVVSSIAQGFSQGGIIGAVIAGVSSIGEGILKAATESAKFKAELAEAREEARGLRFEMALSEGVDSIFGTNGVRNIQNAVAGIKEAEKAMRDLGGKGTFKNRQNFWSVGFGVGEGGKQFSLQEMADSLGRELYDSYGNLNAETLQEILDKYDKLKSADRAWIEQAITNSENYTKAMEQLDKAVEDILGNVVSSASASIVDNWKKAGDAALDYADIMDDVATKFAEMAVESALLSTVFDEKKKEEFKALIAKGAETGDYSNAMALLNSSLEEVRKTLPALQEQVLDPLLGYISDAQETSNTRSSGISKELVERNSTLLASYINAIRADVSVTRNDIHTYLPVIASNLSLLTVNDSPSLAEYQAEVQARLADISQTNAAIAQDMSDFVFRFRSVVATSSSGGSAIRTTK